MKEARVCRILYTAERHQCGDDVSNTDVGTRACGGVYGDN